MTSDQPTRPRRTCNAQDFAGVCQQDGELIILSNPLRPDWKPVKGYMCSRHVILANAYGFKAQIERRAEENAHE